MGIPKHGKDSARSKSSKKYKETGQRLINKAKKAEKLADGKKIKSRKMQKTRLMLLDELIRNTPKSVPFVDERLGVLWGTDKNDPDTLKTAKKKSRHTPTRKPKKEVVKGRVYTKMPYIDLSQE